MGRYQSVYRLNDNLYQSSSPIIIKAGALLIDSKENKVIGQLKFQNISNLVIKAIQISLRNFDVAGTELENVNNFQYLDLELKSGEEYGSKVAIEVPNIRTRSFFPSKTKVFFDDGSFWESMSEWNELPEPELKTGDYQYLIQYKIELGNQAQYEYKKIEDGWFCSCGLFNNTDKCKHCFNNREKHELVNDDYIFLKIKQRYEEEKTAEEKARDELIRKRKKRHMLLGTACILLFVGIGVYAAIYVQKNVVIPQKKYNKAQQYYASQEYDEAIRLYEELGDYKDSVNNIKICNEKLIQKYLSDKNYALATDRLNMNGESKGEAYCGACQLFDDNEYYYSFVEFVKLGNYRESKNYIELIVDKLSSNDYENQIYERCIYACRNYQVEADIREKIELSYAKLMIKQDRIQDAYNLLKSIELDEAKEYMSYCSAILNMENGYLEEAMNQFSANMQFENSSNYYLLCEEHLNENEYYECIGTDINNHTVNGQDDLEFFVCINMDGDVIYKIGYMGGRYKAKIKENYVSFVRNDVISRFYYDTYKLVTDYSEYYETKYYKLRPRD